MNLGHPLAFQRGAVAVACMWVAACQSPQPGSPWIDVSAAPMRAPAVGAAVVGSNGSTVSAAPASIQASTPETKPGPAAVAASALRNSSTPTAAARQTEEPNSGPADIVVNFDQISLPAFIQVAYGTILKRAVSIDPTVLSRTDVVTFRASKPQTAAEMSRLVRQLLKSYGLTVQDYEGLVRVLPDSAATGYLPQIRRGRAQADVPSQLRPIFQLVELEAVRVGDVAQWVRTIFGSKITVLEDASRQALLISGQSDDVAASMDVIQLLDQPALRGNRSVRLNPVNSGADELARRLNEVMVAQGIASSFTPSANSPLLFFPIAPLNAVFVFASTDALLDHAVAWARELDQAPSRSAAGAVFSFTVKHADASDIARVFGELLGATNVGSSAAGAAASSTGQSVGMGAQAGTGNTQRPSVTSITAAGGVRIVINGATNTLLVQGGKSEDFARWQQLLTDLDKPVKSALIEVVVAELSMTDNSSFGVEWALQDILRRNGAAAISTLGGLGVATRGGLSITLRDSAQAVRGLINALASDSQARILSSPKLMARNGETASIQVGQEVPIITSQQSTPTGSGFFGGTNASVLQTVQYRSTGVILRVKPVIHSNNRIDLEVSQEVSSAAETRTGVASSPTISNRRVETKLSMRDGTTVLLAGLISSNDSQSNTGLPLAKDVPILGNLFKNQSRSGGRTELVVLITSYVIDDDLEAESITEAFRNSLGPWARETLPLKRPSIQAPSRMPQVDPSIGGEFSPANRPSSNTDGFVAPTVSPWPIRLRGQEPAPALVPPAMRGAAPASNVPAQRAASAPGASADVASGSNPAAVTGSAGSGAVADPNLLKELEALRKGSR